MKPFRSARTGNCILIRFRNFPGQIDNSTVLNISWIAMLLKMLLLLMFLPSSVYSIGLCHLSGHWRACHPTVSSAAMLFGGWGASKKEEPQNGGGLNARDADFARRQARLKERQAIGSSAPKGQVEVTFPQKGNKVVLAQQGEPVSWNLCSVPHMTFMVAILTVL